MSSSARSLMRIAQLRNHAISRGLRTSTRNAAASNFNMPAMSPTMMEGNIASWKVKEGDKFKAGDVLLEIETDKAQIDVEAQDDGYMAKIFVPDGTKGVKVGARIGVIAEIDDDLSSLEIPPEPKSAAPPAAAEEPQESKKTEKPTQAPASSQPRSDTAAQVASSSSHTPKKSHHPPPKEPFTQSPSVMSLLHINKLSKEDIPKIPATGPRGRLLKGDVLAYVGSINKSAPQEVEGIVDKLAHLDLSNIKIRQAPAPEKVTKEEKKEAASKAPVVTDVDLTVEVNLENMRIFQREMNQFLNTYPSDSLLIQTAASFANNNLPPSKVPPTASQIFDELVGVAPRAPKPYKPTLTAAEVQTSPPPLSRANKTDIFDILSGKARGSPAKSAPVQSKIVELLALKVPKQDEKRGREFLQRVKTQLEENPRSLFKWETVAAPKTDSPWGF